MRKQFCYCRCFLKRNLYLKEYDMHFTYTDTSQFFNDYAKIFNSKGWNDIELVEEKLKDEVQKRKDEIRDSAQRRRTIAQNYVPLHPDIFTLSEDFLHPTFLKICESINQLRITDEKSLEHVDKHRGKLYTFPVFSQQFCQKLVQEIKHFENSSLPKRRPNTMNKYGINVDDLGLESFISELRTKYLEPVTSLLFPEWGGSCLDSHKAFVVAYQRGGDVELGCHYDNAEVTLNVCLNDNFSDGDLFFGPMRFEQSSSSFKTGREHTLGKGLLHRGQQMHGAFPITEGERYNLIIWMRSSEVRNELCPMCDRTPDLEPVEGGAGDGFTRTVDQLACVAC